MKFRKTAMAVALASMAAAPLAQADVTLSGYIGVIIGGSDFEDPVTGDDGPGDLTMSSDDSTINVAASHTMNSGLTAYGNYRLDSGLTGSTPAGDNVWVGIKGGFGDIRLGEVPDASEYGQVAGDALLDVGGENAGISYTGAFGPVTLGLNWSPQNNSDRTGAGIKFALGGFNIGIGAADLDGLTQTSAGASFSFAGASVAVALKDKDNGVESIGAKIGYGISGVSLGLTIEQGTGDANEDTTLVRFDAGYDLGGGMNISTRIQSTTDDADDANDLSTYRLMLAKSF